MHLNINICVCVSGGEREGTINEHLLLYLILDRKHIYCLTPTGQTVWHQYWKMFEHFERGGGETYCIAKGW